MSVADVVRTAATEIWLEIYKDVLSFDVVPNSLTCRQGHPTCYQYLIIPSNTTVYPKKYAHGFCFAVLCCGYTLPDYSISIRLISLALWQSNDCPNASKATLMNMDKYFMRIHYERLHNRNKAKHNKTVCIFLGIYCSCMLSAMVMISVHPYDKKFPVKKYWLHISDFC